MAKIIESCYVLSIKKRVYSIYCVQSSGIYRCSYGEDGWGPPERITENAVGKLSVNISESGELFIFCQDRSGNIILHHFDGNKWAERPVQKNLANAVYNLKIHSIIKDNTIHLLYNIPSGRAGDARYKIVSQKMSGGEWLPHTEAVESAADSDSVFTVQNISTDHYVMYYQTTGRENSFGYKEFYLPDSWGSFFPLHKTLHTIADKSVVTTREGIHFALVMRGLYSSQIIYNRKFGPSVGAPIVIFEASRIENVSLFLHKGAVYITFSAGGYGYFSTVSNDGGKTFTRPARLRVEGVKLIKAEYICDSPQNAGTAVHDFFTDEENPGKAPFIEDVIDNFYTYPVNPEPAQKANVKELTEQQHERAAKVETRNEVNDLNELLEIKSRKIAILENKLESSYREISDKNRQIMELNSMLGRKNEETANANSVYRDTIKRLKDELSEQGKLILKMNEAHKSLPDETSKDAKETTAEPLIHEPVKEHGNCAESSEDIIQEQVTDS